MSGKKDPNEEPPLQERKTEVRLPIMGLGSEELQPPTFCFDFPNVLVGKKESQEKYPPIVTIDGRVDTDIDHLIDEEEDYTGPVVEIPSKFPKPHIFSVVDGSLDDDIDNYLNDDGTIEHTLVDAPKNFNPSELKDVASKDAAPHKGLDLATRRSGADMPLTNRSYNKTHAEHSENDVTNEMVDGELSINVGSQELGADDQPSEELIEAGTRQDIVAVVSYEKMNNSDNSLVADAVEKRQHNLDLKPAKSMDLEGISETDKMQNVEVERNAAGAEGPPMKLTKENDTDVRKLPSSSAVDDPELFERDRFGFSSPSEHFIGREIERCHTVLYCQEDAAGRGDSVLSTMIAADKEFNLPNSAETAQVKPEDDLLQHLQMVNKMSTNQGRVEGHSEKVDISEKQDPKHAHEKETEEIKKKDSDAGVEKTNEREAENEVSRPVCSDETKNETSRPVCSDETKNETSRPVCSDEAKNEVKSLPVQSADLQLIQIPNEDKKSFTSSKTPSVVDNSDSDIDISESLALLSKLEEFKGDKQKTKELLNQFKQLVLDTSQTKQDKASKSESMQSTLTETLHKTEKNPQDQTNESEKLADQQTAQSESQECETESHQRDNASSVKPEGKFIHKSISDSAKDNPELDKGGENKEEQGAMSDSFVFDRKLKDSSPLATTKAEPMIDEHKDSLCHVEKVAKQKVRGSDDRHKSYLTTCGVGAHEEKRGTKAAHQQQSNRCMDENDSRKDDRINNDEKHSLREHRSASRKAARTLKNVTESDKPDTKHVEGMPFYKNSEDKSKKLNKHNSHSQEKKKDNKDNKDNKDPNERSAGVEFNNENREHNPQDQKSAHKCASFVGINNDNVSPKNCSPGHVSGASSPLGENEHNHRKKKRDRTSSMDSTKRWRSAERKEKLTNDKDGLQKQSKKDKNQSIKESLKVAIKVAEESMSAAAKVARALSFVIEATKPKMNLDTSTDEEGLQQSYNKLLDTMNTLCVSKQGQRSHSGSPGKKRDRSVDKTINQAAVASYLHGNTTKESESVVHREKPHATKEHRKKDKVSNDFERKQSSSQLAPTSGSKCSESKRGSSPNTQIVHSVAPMKADKKETETIPVVKTKISDGKQHRSEESKLKASEAKNATPEDKQRSAEVKPKVSEDKHTRGKSADVRHRADSENRRKHDEVKGKNEERKPKPERTERTRQDRSVEGRNKTSDTKKSSEILKESKKEKSHEAVHKDGADTHKAAGHLGYSAGHHQSHSNNKDKVPPEPAGQHAPGHRSHRAEHKEETGDGVKVVQKQGQTHSKPPQHAQQNQDQTHKEVQRSQHKEDKLQHQDVTSLPQTTSQEHTLPSQNKLENSAQKTHAIETDMKTEGPIVHDWRIPLTKHNVNRKSESYFEQVTLPKPIEDEKASKVLIRRLLRGSRVDMLDSEASETDSLEYDSNFNRVLNHRIKSDSMLRRQEKSTSQGGRSRHVVEDHEHVTVLNSRDSSVHEWRQDYYYDDEYWSSSQETVRDDIQTCCSYRASSQFSDRKRSTSAHESQHRKVQAVPKPDPHCGTRHHARPLGQVLSPELHRSCPILLKSSDPQCCESKYSSLTSGHESDVTVSSSGPRISLLKQNIMTHQLPFPERRKGIDQRYLRDGVMFSPIYEEETTDVLSSVESGSWWQPTRQLNTNNGNVYDSSVDDVGSDVDGPAKGVVSVGQNLKTGPATTLPALDERGVVEESRVGENVDEVELLAVDEAIMSDKTAVFGELIQNEVELVAVYEAITSDRTAVADELIQDRLDMSAVSEMTGDGTNVTSSLSQDLRLGHIVVTVPPSQDPELGHLVVTVPPSQDPELGHLVVTVPPSQDPELGHLVVTVPPSVEQENPQRELESDEELRLKSTDHPGFGESNQQVDQLDQSLATSDVYKEQDQLGLNENTEDALSAEHQKTNVEESGDTMKVQEHGESGQEMESVEHKTLYLNERQTSPDKPVPDTNDQFPLRIKQETKLFKNRSQQLSDQTLCTHLVDISKGAGTVDNWLRRCRSASVGVNARHRLRQQELISLENIEIVKRLLTQETVYNREEQLLDYEKKFFKQNNRLPDDSQKKLDGNDVPTASEQANYLAHEQAKAIDELYSKGKSNNRVRRTLSLPPIRKRSVTIDNVKSAYSRDGFEKDYQDHCIKLLLISKQPVESNTRMAMRAHSVLANRLEEREKRVRLATQKIDEMCKNRQPPYAPRPKSKT